MTPRLLAIGLAFAVAASNCRAKELVFPKIDRRSPPAADECHTRLSPASFVFDVQQRDHFQMDFNNCDLSSYDLSRSSDLFYSSFNSRTLFPKRLPPDFVPAKILDLGKNPGLGVRKLHAAGITGTGVGIAILDQTLLTDHAEYADRLRLYEEFPNAAPAVHMHGPTVASIAAGKTVGVAPGADLYFIAMSNGEGDGAKFKFDLAYAARGIDRIVEINSELPKARKIRVISISLGMEKNWKGYDAETGAIARAEKAGILVLTVQNDKFRFDGLGRPPLADPEQPASYTGGTMFCGNQKGSGSHILQIPMDSRTFADPGGPHEYSFFRVGGQSWIVPWVAGLYALACQARPDVTPELFWKAALETADAVDFKRDGADYRLAKVVNPVALIARLRQK